MSAEEKFLNEQREIKSLGDKVLSIGDDISFVWGTSLPETPALTLDLESLTARYKDWQMGEFLETCFAVLTEERAAEMRAELNLPKSVKLKVIPLK